MENNLEIGKPKMKVPAILFSFLVVLMIPALLYSTTYYVNDVTGNDSYNGLYPEPGTFPDGPKKTIQAGIDISTDGDTVIVDDGIYKGDGNRDLDFAGRAISLRSQSGSRKTIIACEGSGRGFYCVSVPNPGTVIEGFTITGGAASNSGGGVFCQSSILTVMSCVIIDNSAGDYGGGLICTDSSEMTLVNCLLAGNSSGDLGGGVHCASSELTVINCTAVGNSASSYGGGIMFSWGSTGTMTNSIVWANTAADGGQVALKSTAMPSALSVSCCDVEGGESAVYVQTGCSLDWAAGNIDVDPLTTPDGHLRAGSPCMDLSSSGPEDDVDGEERPFPAGGSCDIGADEFVDTDGDRLPDWWEMEHFGSPTAAEADADQDSDGLTNLWEYEFGTDPTVAGPQLFVNGATGNDSWDGLARVWDGIHGPMKNIQTAIDAANLTTVTVADGIYKGPLNRNLDFGGKAVVLRSENGAEKTIIDCEESGRGFYFYSGEEWGAIVDGFTIRNGKASAIDPYGGGGIKCWDSSPTIRNCIIIDNSSAGQGMGGGVYCARESNMTIANCVIKSNIADGRGGGISCQYGSMPTISDSIITANSAHLGGGIRCDGSDVTITNCTIADNSAISYGGGIYASESDAAITDCTIADNSASQGGGICCLAESDVTITRCLIGGNSAEDSVNGKGGGIWCEVSDATITDCIISNNRAEVCGGGIWCKWSDARITDSMITANHSWNGGGLYLYEESSEVSRCRISGNSARHGGGVYCYSSEGSFANCIITSNLADDDGGAVSVVYRSKPSVTNCTIVGNSAVGHGAGIYVNTEYDPMIVNSIVWDNDGEEIYVEDSDGHPLVSYCDVQGGWSGPGSNNIDVDPLFIHPERGDYRLWKGSQCINAGTSIGAPSEDIDGESRPCDGYVDIGADEYVNTDDDGLLDYWEVKYFGNLDEDENSDPDLDGIINVDEYMYGSDPFNWNTDGDGLSDLDELTSGSNPSSFSYYVSEVVGDDTCNGLYPEPRIFPDGPKKTIQAGIDVASNTEEVIVAAGTYTGDGNRDLDFGGKGIALRSRNGAQNTIIDCDGSEGDSHRGFYFHSGEATDSIVDGFTIIDGYIGYYGGDGGGIYCEGASPRIVNCTIRDCQVEDEGGGIYCWNGNPVVSTCTIIDNSATTSSGLFFGYCYATVTGCVIDGNFSGGWAGGIGARGSTLRVRSCSIRANAAKCGGGIVIGEDSRVTVARCVLAGNSAAEHGGGIFSGNNLSSTIANCTIIGNIAGGCGGGVHCIWRTNPAMMNCVLWDNQAPNGSEIALLYSVDPSTLTISYCDVQGGQSDVYVESGSTLNWQEGNIDEEPLFVEAGSGDFHLMPLSPCVDKGDPASDYSNEPLPNGCRINMGAYGNTSEATPSPGDVDGDLDIDMDDIVLVYEALGSGVYDPALDVDGDGAVTFADLRIVYDHICEGEKDFGGVSTLWVLDYMVPTDPTVEGLNPYEDQSQMDNDGDGRTNYEESIAGTDPTDASSLFEITEIDFSTWLDIDSVAISWTTVPGKSYCMYYSETLGEEAHWTAVEGDYEVIHGIATQFLDVGSDKKMRFFKVKVW